MNPTDWINRRTAAASRRSRERRMRLFADAISAAGLRGATILDVGGTRAYWEEWGRLLPPCAVSRIDVVNLPGQMRDLAGQTLEIAGIPVRFVPANLLDGPCPALDERYDVVHCISVIEHVGAAAAQRAFADALRRLGRLLWIQTPAKEFPLEAHFRLPFFAWWPLPLRAFFNWRFRLGVMPRHRSWPEAVAFCRSTRLLAHRAFSRLFPSCRLWTERILLLPKCYIATDLPSPHAPWLFLTAAIDHRNCAGAMFSTEDRLRQYLGAFRFFLRALRRHPDRIRGIVLCEDAGGDPAPFRALVDRELPPALRARVELLFLPTDGFLPEKGKSYNEMRSIDIALDRSALVGPGDLVLKMTGRYPQHDLARTLRDLSRAAAAASPLQVCCYVWPRIRTRWNKSQIPLVDTRRIAFRASAWRESFAGVYRTADNDAGRYFESIVFDLFRQHRNTPGWVAGFTRPPLILAPPGHRKYLFGHAIPPSLGRLHSLLAYLYLRLIAPFSRETDRFGQ